MQLTLEQLTFIVTRYLETKIYASVDFALWRYLTNLVHETPPNNLQELRERKMNKCNEIRQTNELKELVGSLVKLILLEMF